MRYALYPILMGSLGWWAAFSVMPLAVQWELPLAIVNRIQACAAGDGRT